MPRAGISGFGIISALGGNVPETECALFSGPTRLPMPPRRIETALKLPVFEIEVPEVPADVPGIPLRFLLRALDEALEDARLTRQDLQKRRVGVAIGTTVACQLDNIATHARLRTGDLGDLAPLYHYMIGMPAEYIRRTLKLNGPAVTISNACASGADAAMLALDWLRSGRCDLVISGGCDSVSKVAFNGFNALRVCSHAPCRPFDAERSGLNLGDGAGVVIMEDPKLAAARGATVKWELGGAGKTADAFHITQPEGGGRELERAIRLAIDEAELTPEGVDFVNAHGTGPLVNDRVESAVLARIFGENLRYQSTKALTGHTLGAAGAMELIFSLLMLDRKTAVKSVRYANPSEDIPVAPLSENTEVPGNAALSTSLAFGGSNTALVLRGVRRTETEIRRKPMYISAFRMLNEGEPDRDELARLCRKYSLRRPDRLTQLELAAADAVAEALNGDDETALLTATAYGPANTTCRVLDDILDYPEEEILPTGFSHSVVNAAASYIGTALGIHGPTFSLAGFEDVFHEAVSLAETLLACGRCKRVLIVSGDEKSIISEAAKKLLRSEPPLRDEGACAMVLTTAPEENRFGRLELNATLRQSGRSLPGGVPSELVETCSAPDKERIVRLAPLVPPEWRI